MVFAWDIIGQAVPRKEIICIGESSPSLYSTCFPRHDDPLLNCALAYFVEHANVDIVDTKRRQVDDQKFCDGDW